MEDILVTPFQTGLVTSTDPWSMPNDGFQELTNFSIDHGRLVKRSGRRFMGQMVSTGTTVTTERVMGIGTYSRRDAVNITVVNSLKYMNRWDGNSPGAFVIIDDGIPRFSGNEDNFFWYSNWQPPEANNRLFLTNGVELSNVAGNNIDGIRYYDFATNSAVTVDYIPTVSSNAVTGTTVSLVGCKLIFTLSGRLVVLYTYEKETGQSTLFFPQRARWSKYQNATEANWDDTIPGNGDFVDAATGEQIVSAQYHKDGLIVFFTNSVWLLYPTQDPRIAFAWKRLNSYRACDGKMASQSFDDYSTALGIRGIVASTGAQTQRIDDRIENFGPDIINVNRFSRVYCARSYQSRKWWTLYANRWVDEVDKVLVFNEDDKSWSTYDTDLNVLGYVIDSFDATFADFTNGETFQDFGDDTFQSFNQDGETVFAGGDRAGKIYLLEQGGEDYTSSSASDPITCSFNTAILNPWKNQGLDAKLLYVDFLVETDDRTTATVSFFKDDENAPYLIQEMNFLPPLGYIASIQDISLADPAVAKSPNHGLATGDEIFIYGVQGLVDSGAPPVEHTDINAGPFTVTYINDSSFSLDDVDTSALSAYLGGGAIYRKAFNRTKVWKRVYAGGSSMIHNFSLSSTGKNTEITIIAYRPTFKQIGNREIN